jgi:hypothetical protein
VPPKAVPVGYCGDNGETVAPIHATTSPTTEIVVLTTVQLFSVSCSVKPLSLLITQKPLSFIHESINWDFQYDLPAAGEYTPASLPSTRCSADSSPACPSGPR